ncbi:asparaginase [Amycolatopsis albispora]|uniref:Asparaginase n=1 Tax=Amycolatopsis albispora TaxID=1804986 RepID=A0A344LEN8_9PSEU|nr:asparaginase [Amycolatopsis albispora]AXB46512.1 asparaginase [Amycolatopsis albispora]
MNPTLVEVVRSGFTESIHRGSLLVTGPGGEPVLDLGATRVPVYPRSSNKPLQALGMLRAGLEVGDEDLAIICASHNGEPEHVRRVAELLARHGLSEADLRCPADYPLHGPSRIDAIRAGEPSRLAMNCSGKHAGMLAACVQRGWPTEDYLSPDHKLQRIIGETIEDLIGEEIAHTGVDGCGAPLFAFSLAGLARSFSRLTTSADEAERRIDRCMRANPWLIGGTSREDTVLMLAVDGLLAKGGAEGVHAAALPDGSAITMKIDDGGQRVREAVLVTALRRLGHTPGSDAAAAVLDGLARGAGWVRGGGHEVGEFRVTF